MLLATTTTTIIVIIIVGIQLNHDVAVVNSLNLLSSPLSFVNRREWIAVTATTTSFLPWKGWKLSSEDDESIMHLLSTTSSASSAPADIPRVGYSLYKTDAAQTALGVQLALQTGVKHFDLASLYSNNEQVGQVLQQYIASGDDGSVSNGGSNPAIRQLSQLWTTTTSQQRQRRQELFLTLKVPPASSSQIVQQSVQTELQKLGVDYVDLVMIHSPLAESTNRLRSYEALLDLQNMGIAKSVGVCHYGTGPLNELITAGLPPPAVIQLVLSPFNQHKDVAAWADQHGSVLSCSAWSMLSSVNGPQEGWDKLAKIAKAKGMTKAQVLVRWALQRGYLCVPRSGTKSKVDRLAIAENSYRGVADFFLERDEMDLLNGLDEQLPAGRLGVKDGWNETSIVDKSWDPTLLA